MDIEPSRQHASNDSASLKLDPWDGTPITASLFLRNIGDFAAQQGWYSLLMKGYFVHRGNICTVSNDAIATIRAHFHDAAANPLPDDIQNPPSPMPATRDCTYVPTTDDRRTFVASPEIFMCESQRHAETLLAAIQDPDVRRRVRSESRGDARRVIQVIARIRSELTSAQISNQLARLSRHVKQGLDSLSLMSWSRWRTAYDDLAFCLPATHALPQSYIAQITMLLKPFHRQRKSFTVKEMERVTGMQFL